MMSAVVRLLRKRGSDSRTSQSNEYVGAASPDRSSAERDDGWTVDLEGEPSARRGEDGRRRVEGILLEAIRRGASEVLVEERDRAQPLARRTSVQTVAPGEPCTVLHVFVV